MAKTPAPDLRRAFPARGWSALEDPRGRRWPHRRVRQRCWELGGGPRRRGYPTAVCPAVRVRRCWESSPPGRRRQQSSGDAFQPCWRQVPPPRAGLWASAMSFIELSSAAWNWAISLAIFSLEVAHSTSDAKAPSTPSVPVIVPSLPSAVVLAEPLRNFNAAKHYGRDTERDETNNRRRGRET